MADVKWVKLTIDMFDNKKIKHLRKLPEGDSIVLIWVMLITMAGKCNDNGLIYLTQNIPYTTKMLADELNFKENTVKLALEALQQLEMIDISNSFLVISNWEKYQNVEGMDKLREQNRIRVAKHREKQKALTCNVTDNVTVTQCNATDKDIDIEKEKDKDNINCAPQAAHKELNASIPIAKKADIEENFEKLWQLYPNKKGKGRVSDSKKRAIFNIGYNEMEKAINRYINDLSQDPWRKPQNGSTFFNSGYVDYLDENYQPIIPRKSNDTNVIAEWEEKIKNGEADDDPFFWE